MTLGCRWTRACATARCLVVFSCWLLTATAAQPLGSPHELAAAAAAKSGPDTAESECSLYLLGGNDSILRAGMRCTGPQPTIALASRHLAGFARNFTGVAHSSNCSASAAKTSNCLLTICDGSLVLQRSSLWWVRVPGVDRVVCVVGDSKVDVHNSIFSGNSATPLAVFDKACLLLNGSTIHDNSVKESGGGLWAEGRANVTITGRSKVHGNNAFREGGGLWASGNVSVTLTGGSSVRGNTAGASGGGLYVEWNVTVTLTGGSSVCDNTAQIDGGGLAVHHASVRLEGGSSVYGNTARDEGGGLHVNGYVLILTGGSSVHGNSAVWAGGGIFVQFGSMTVTGGSSVYSNTAGIGGGGGLKVSLEATVTLTGGSSVYANTAKDQGGGLCVEKGGSAILAGSSVHSNMVEGIGGGLSVAYDSRVTISNQSTVSNNTSGQGGGGIAVEFYLNDITFDTIGRPIGEDPVVLTSQAIISNSTVSNNNSTRSPGGGLAVGGTGTVELVNGTVVSQNAAFKSSGGGVVLLGNSILRADTTVRFVDNIVSRGSVGSTIAAFMNSSLHLPVRGGHVTKCSTGVYLGWSSCQPGEVLQNDICVCCPQHTFSFTNVPCEPCPANGQCTGGNIVQPLPGYWSSAPTSVQMHRCPLSTTACNYTGPTHECNEGYTGPLCGSCTLPQYGMLNPFRCGRCMQPKAQLGVYVLVSSASVGFVTVTVHTTWKDNLTGTREVLATDLIKVLVQYLQYTVIIGSVAVSWPLFDVQRWFQAVNIVYAVGAGQALSLDCWLYYFVPQGKLPIAMQRQLVFFIAPLVVLLAVLMLEWLAWAVWRWVVPLVWQSKQSAQNQPGILRKVPVTLLVSAYYAFPTLLRAAFSFFACLRIDRLPPEVQLPPGATAPLNHTAGYWVSDITQQCFSGYHKGWALGLGLPSILLWCIAVPVAMGLGLFLCRAKADTDSFREHFGFLYRSYKPERMWWEAVWAVRTIVLTMISVFAIPMERYFAVLSLLVIFMVSAALQIVFDPYAFVTLHRMHMISTACLAATTLGALAMFAYEIQESTALRLRIAIAVLVMLVNITFVVWCIWKLVPFVMKWFIKAYKLAQSGASWVVNKAACGVCAGQPSPRRGRGRGRQHGAGCCTV